MGSSRACVSATASWKTNSTVYSTGSGVAKSAGPRRLSKEPAEENSQLIEIVRTRHVNVAKDFHLGTFFHNRNAEKHHRNLCPQPGTIAYSLGNCNELNSIAIQTHKYKIGSLTSTFVDCVVFI